MKGKTPETIKNPKARRDYTIGETFEAGIVLRGTEVKSLRAGKGQIADAFARIEKGEVYLYNAHIEEYAMGTNENHKPKAVRKLLLNKHEIRKLFDYSDIKGYTIVPLSLYWKDGKVKVELGVGKGKDKGDKRQDIKKRDTDRESRRALMHHAKGR